MRSTLPLRAGGFAGALSVVAITAAPAAAQADTQFVGPLSFKLGDPRLTFGDRVVVKGSSSHSAVGRQAVLELRSQASGAPWRPIASQVIRSHRRFSLRGRIHRTGSVRIRIPATPGGGELRSRDRRVRVKPRVIVRRRSLQVTAGRRVVAAGFVRPAAAGLPVVLEISRGGRWVTLDSDRTSPGGRYALADRRRGTMSAKARVRVSGRAVGLSATHRGLGRIDVYRRAYASWYGPGLYGNHLGCGGRLNAGSLGVAHKRLPCGTLVTFRRSGRSVRVPVIDRGPYVGGREYDLTAATARRLGFSGHGPILATR